MKETRSIEENKLTNLLENIQELPALPETAKKIMEMCNNPMTSVGDIEKVFNSDQALAVKILKLVNSSYFSLPNKISSVGRAISFLGFNAIKSLALSISFINVFLKNRITSAFDYRLFWEHSFGVAETAKALAPLVNYYDEEEAYITGLIHDLGRLVLDQYLTVQWIELLEESKLSETPLFELEKQKFGVSHAELGGFILERWNFPAKVSDAVFNHHTFSPGVEPFKLCLLINVADYICHKLSIGASGARIIQEPSTLARTMIDIDDIDMDDIRAELLKRLNSIKRFLFY